MEQYFECACCGEENHASMDLDEGDFQELVVVCAVCGRQNLILATFNYHPHSYDLEICHEVVD